MRIANSLISETNSQVRWLLDLQTFVLTLVSDMEIDQKKLSRKNEELTQALREKRRKLLQTQELYDKLKRRAMLGQVQDAASDAVDDTIQASSTANRFVDRVGAQNQRPASTSMFQGGQNSRVQALGLGQNIGLNMGPPQINKSGNADGAWSRFSSPGNQGNVQRKEEDWLPYYPHHD
jgi:E3 ubiquitin-protein ligase CCNP1IP1